MFNQFRCHHSFIRRRTIVCRGGPNKTFLTFVSDMKEKGLDKIFAQPNTHLKIGGLENLQEFPLEDLDYSFRLTGVIKLDISNDVSQAQGKEVCYDTRIGLSIIVPNIVEVDMSYLKYNGPFNDPRGTLTTFAYNGTCKIYSPYGSLFNA